MAFSPSPLGTPNAYSLMPSPLRAPSRMDFREDDDHDPVTPQYAQLPMSVDLSGVEDFPVTPRALLTVRATNRLDLGSADDVEEAPQMTLPRFPAEERESSCCSDCFSDIFKKISNAAKSCFSSMRSKKAPTPPRRFTFDGAQIQLSNMIGEVHSLPSSPNQSPSPNADAVDHLYALQGDL